VFVRTTAASSTVIGGSIPYRRYDGGPMRYLRMFSNAAIAGGLASAYVSLLILQLNPTCRSTPACSRRCS